MRAADARSAAVSASRIRVRRLACAAHPGTGRGHRGPRSQRYGIRQTALRGNCSNHRARAGGGSEAQPLRLPMAVPAHAPLPGSAVQNARELLGVRRRLTNEGLPREDSDYAPTNRAPPRGLRSLRRASARKGHPL